MHLSHSSVNIFNFHHPLIDNQLIFDILMMETDNPYVKGEPYAGGHDVTAGLVLLSIVCKEEK